MHAFSTYIFRASWANPRLFLITKVKTQCNIFLRKIPSYIENGSIKKIEMGRGNLAYLIMANCYRPFRNQTLIMIIVIV